MVVLIVGMSLGGYIPYKFLGQRRGHVARRDPGRGDLQHGHHRELRSQAHNDPAYARSATIVILIASTVSACGYWPNGGSFTALPGIRRPRRSG